MRDVSEMESHGRVIENVWRPGMNCQCDHVNL